MIGILQPGETGTLHERLEAARSSMRIRDGINAIRCTYCGRISCPARRTQEWSRRASMSSDERQYQGYQRSVEVHA